MEVSKLLLLFYITYGDSPVLSNRKHVYRDLHPYVCLEKGCTKATQDFQKRKQWARHMAKEHWRTWTCPFGCPLGFPTSEDSLNHAREKHLTQVSTDRVEDLVSLSSNVDLTRAEGKCPVCLAFDIKNSRVYESHVAGHLEQLALFVLPQTSGDESDQDDKTDDDQSGDWETNSGERQVSDMKSDPGEEALLGPGLETQGDFQNEESPTGYSYPELEALAFDHILKKHRIGDGQVSDLSAPDHEGDEAGEDGEPKTTALGAKDLKACKLPDCDRERVYGMIGSWRIYSSHCEEHTCQASRNGDTPFCTKPRSPENRYCVFHGRCRGSRGCSAQATRSEFQPSEYLCYNHRCVVPACVLPRVKFDLCERHACHIPYCRQARLGTSSGGKAHCPSHTCTADGCPCPVLADRKKFCFIHACLSAECTRRHVPSARFCEEHNCRSETCPFESVDQGRYCWHHTCTEAGCKEPAKDAYAPTRRCKRHSPGGVWADSAQAAGHGVKSDFRELVRHIRKRLGTGKEEEQPPWELGAEALRGEAAQSGVAATQGTRRLAEELQQQKDNLMKLEEIYKGKQREKLLDKEALGRFSRRLENLERLLSKTEQSIPWGELDIKMIEEDEEKIREWMEKYGRDMEIGKRQSVAEAALLDVNRARVKTKMVGSDQQTQGEQLHVGERATHCGGSTDDGGNR